MKHHDKKFGFTIVELLIVIVVISILAAITVTAYNGIQSRARDTQLQSSATMWIKALKLYYADTGVYPTSSQLLDKTWTKANMTGVTDDLYKAVTAESSTTLVSRDPVTSSLNSAADYFKTGYINYRASTSYWLNADGTFNDNDTSCNSGTSCPTFVLVYRLSSSALVYSYGS